MTTCAQLHSASITSATPSLRLESLAPRRRCDQPQSVLSALNTCRCPRSTRVVRAPPVAIIACVATDAESRPCNRKPSASVRPRSISRSRNRRSIAYFLRAQEGSLRIFRLRHDRDAAFGRHSARIVTGFQRYLNPISALLCHPRLRRPQLGGGLYRNRGWTTYDPAARSAPPIRWFALRWRCGPMPWRPFGRIGCALIWAASVPADRL
jgi:hypothetical protein